MEVDIREFLKEIGEDTLEARGVLRPDPRFEYLLQNTSVAPLLRLMREHNVTRLVAEDRDWFLAGDGKFGNPKSITLASGKESVFNEQNPYINPFYKGTSKEPSGD